MKQHKAYSLRLVILLALMVGSCIKEDRDNCETLHLSFRYLGDDNVDILQEKICSIQLYLFDEQGRYVTEWVELGDAAAQQHTRLNIAPGKYTIVGVGNNDEKTLVHDRGSQILSTFVITHPNILEGLKYVDSFDDLYLGSKEIVIKDGVVTRDTLDFECSHDDVIVEVRGYNQESVTRALPTIFTITDLTASTFLENIPTQRKCACVQMLEFQDREVPTYQFTFNIQRFGLKHGRDINSMIQLRNPDGSIVYEFGLYDYLMENPSILLDIEEVVIPILIEFTPVGVEIKLPEWYIQDVTPGFDD
ncbi:MAG: FimB/Mfa2 family fimbrial subunit [Marinifilaceae bacterium]